MATALTCFQHRGFVMLRAATDPVDPDRPDVDLDDPIQVASGGRAWLDRWWSRREVREAVQSASGDLAARIEQILSCEPGEVAARDVRRAVLSAAAYGLRWSRRPTPFGLFAGVTAASIGPAAAKVGRKHRVYARADAEWLAAVTDQLEQHPDLRHRLTVVTDSAGVVRDGRFVVAGRADLGARTPGPLREVSVRLTGPVQAALTAAATPIRVDALVAHLAAWYPTSSPDTIATMVNALIDQRILITSLRAPMTTVDGLPHLLAALNTAGAADLPDLAPALSQLDEVDRRLHRHNTGADRARQGSTARADVSARMGTLAPGSGPMLATDVRLDANITIPDRVLAEATRAASALLRVSTRPFGSAAWLDYHARFRARYGPGALVGVRDLVADSGLGYPAGYLGGPRPRPAWRTLTERDTTLLALIQQANLASTSEVTLTDADLAALTVGDHADVVAPQRVEIGVMLQAPSTAAIDRGEFDLWVTAAPRSYTSMAGRFAYLLDPPDADRLAASYTASGHPPRSSTGAGEDVVFVQLSFPPRRRHNENVVRVARLLPEMVCLSEHPDGDVVDVDDLAVTADAEQMYLVQRSNGRRVVPQIPHALDTAVQSPPLARFLAEVADARSAGFGPFDFGAARTLPHTPRIRYRRTVLSAARWVLTTADLPTRAGDPGWHTCLHTWRRKWRVPPNVVLRDGELRLPLDLDHQLDRTLLANRLQRIGRVEIHEDLPEEGHGWIGRPAELLIPLTTTAAAARSRSLPVTAAAGPVHRPGRARVINLRIAGNPARFDDILTDHLPPLVDQLAHHGVRRWWVRRHRDLVRPDAEQHLAVFLALTCPDQYGPVAARLASFAEQLAVRGLPAQTTLATYAEQPARYGHGPALAAAEEVFAADTRAAITQLATAQAAGTPAQALAAASMAQLAAAFAPDQQSGYRNLLECLRQTNGPIDRATVDLARRLHDPVNDLSVLRDLPGGDAVADAWAERDTALRDYHRVLVSQRDPSTVLRTLLHEHHLRAVGGDPGVEDVTNRLARSAALRHLTTRNR